MTLTVGAGRTVAFSYREADTSVFGKIPFALVTCGSLARKSCATESFDVQRAMEASHFL